MVLNFNKPLIQLRTILEIRKSTVSSWNLPNSPSSPIEATCCIFKWKSFFLFFMRKSFHWSEFTEETLLWLVALSKNKIELNLSICTLSDIDSPRHKITNCYFRTFVDHKHVASLMMNKIQKNSALNESVEFVFIVSVVRDAYSNDRKKFTNQILEN